MDASGYIFDVYNLLVVQMFGSVLLSIAAVGILLVILLVIGRGSTIFIIYWVGFYAIVMTTLYFGTLGLVAGFVLAFMFASISVVRYFFRKE